MHIDRQTILPVMLAWASTASLAWLDLLLSVVNSLAMVHYRLTQHGKPLPVLTEFVTFPTSVFYGFPLPALLCALFLTFSGRFDAPDRLSLTGLCFVVGFAAGTTIAFGTLLPAIPSYSTELVRP